MRSYWIAGSFLVFVVFVTLAKAFNASDFDFTATGHTQAYAGDSNVLLADFTGPAPVVDTVLLDGAALDPVAGDPLNEFAANQQFLDTDGIVGFGGVEPIIESVDTSLTSDDVVITSSTAPVLTAFPSSESGSLLYGFIDSDNDGMLDGNEDIVHQVVSGEAADLITGTPLRILQSSDNIMYIAEAGTSDYDELTPSAILRYQGSLELENPYFVIQGGTMNFHPFSLADHVCIEDSGNYGAIGPGADFWRDLNGTDCTSFDTGIDVIINGASGIVDASYVQNGYEPSSPYGPLTAGYIDGNGNGIYDCNRASCEAFMIAFSEVVEGQAVNGFVAGPSINAPDGIGIIGNNWAVDPTLMNAYDLSTILTESETRFAYVDTNENGVYDADEDLVELVKSGSAEVFSTGDEFVSMDNVGWYADVNGNDVYSVVTDVLIGSVDNVLDEGGLDGSAIDEVVIPSINGEDLSSFSTTIRYFDADASDIYETGEDIIEDVDVSGYFNADDLESVAFTNTTTDYPVEDADLEGISVYRRVGSECTGLGTDTLIGSLSSAPFFDTPITISDVPFTEPQSYCVYADMSALADGGEYIVLGIGQGNVVFVGAAASPEDVLLTLGGSSSYTSVARTMNVLLTPGSTAVNASTTYTVSFTTSESLVSGDLIRIEFPDEYDVVDSVITCTDDSVSVAGVSSIDGQEVSLTLSTGIAASSDVECVVSAVLNPDTAGPYSTFSVATIRDGIDNLILTEVDTVFPAVSIIDSAIVRSHRRRPSAPAEPHINLTAPASNAALDTVTTIRWSSEGEQKFVNLLYTKNGARTYIAHNISNTGSYDWKVPTHLLKTQFELTIELTDLGVAVATDTEVIGIPINLEEPLSESGFPSWYPPDMGQRLVRVPHSQTVYYVGYDHHLLRPFFTEDVFRSWRLNFDTVAFWDGVEMSQFPIGAPMLPMPGTYLVKEPSNPKVYALEPDSPPGKANPILHWITSEEVARSYFGENWQDRVIDVAPEVINLGSRGYDLSDASIKPAFIGIYH